MSCSRNRWTRTPDGVALVFEEDSLTYAELNRRANQLAHYLRALGVRPDDRVAICVERGFEMIIGLLAVLKAGGAYVPLDPAYPVDRLRFMLEDSQPIALLTQQHLAGLFNEVSPSLPILNLENTAPWGDSAHTNPTRENAGLTPQSLAYVIYTSGSTGIPKGVLVEHKGLSNLIHWHCSAFKLNAGDMSSSVASFGFDAATWEFWPPLCVGAAIMIAASLVTSDPEQLLLWWKEQHIDIGFLSTPMAEIIFDKMIDNRHLRTLLVGGDKLSAPSSHTDFLRNSQ